MRLRPRRGGAGASSATCGRAMKATECTIIKHKAEGHQLPFCEQYWREHGNNYEAWVATEVPLLLAAQEGKQSGQKDKEAARLALRARFKLRQPERIKMTGQACQECGLLFRKKAAIFIEAVDGQDLPEPRIVAHEVTTRQLGCTPGLRFCPLARWPDAFGEWAAALPRAKKGEEEEESAELPGEPDAPGPAAPAA